MILRFFKIFDRKEKVLFFIFFLLLIFSSFLELLGIGLIVPVLNSFLSTDGYNTSNPLLNFFNQIVLFIKGDVQNNSLFPVYLFLGVFLIKALYLLLLSIFQHLFIVKIGKKIFLKAYRTIIYQPYNFFINKKVSASELIATINRDCEVYSNSFMVSIAMLISDTTFLFFIFLFFFLINFKIAIFIIIFSALILFIFKAITNKKVKQLSIARQQIEGIGIKHLQDTFLGVREIKLSFKEKSFIQVFKNFFYKKIRLSSLLVVLNQLPRIWIELMTILIAILVIYNLGNSNNLNNKREFISIMAVYFVAFIRVAPSLNRIMIHFNSIKYSIPNIEKVLEYLDLGTKHYDREFKNIHNRFEFSSISLKNITYNYPGSKNKILKNANLNIKKGDIVGIVGKSGVGKSTLVDMICGFLLPVKGQIIVNKKKLSSRNKNWQKKIGYVSQNSYLFNDTIINNISLDFSEHNYTDLEINKIKKVINITQLNTSIKKLTNKLETKIGESGNNLSGGQRQRIAIARALYREPQLIIFDEATVALDDKTEHKLINAIKKKYSKKKTIIIISHRKSSLKLCDKIYEIKDKKIIKKKFL
tara:strand:- start:106 stop:1866 length:1761 start_codon:yes stop_codon:yes gene_type:complete